MWSQEWSTYVCEKASLNDRKVLSWASISEWGDSQTGLQRTPDKQSDETKRVLAGSFQISFGMLRSFSLEDRRVRGVVTYTVKLKGKRGMYLQQSTYLVHRQTGQYQVVVIKEGGLRSDGHKAYV